MDDKGLEELGRVIDDAKEAEEHLEQIMPSAIHPDDDDYAGVNGPVSPAEEAGSSNEEHEIEDIEDVEHPEPEPAPAHTDEA